MITDEEINRKENAMNFENSIFNNDAIAFVNEENNTISDAILNDFWGKKHIECDADEDAMLCGEFFH